MKNRVLFVMQLHLNPIHAVVQLRPSMEHHKPGGPKKTNIQTSAAENPVKIEEAKEQKPPVPSKKQVSTQFPSLIYFLSINCSLVGVGFILFPRITKNLCCMWSFQRVLFSSIF